MPATHIWYINVWCFLWKDSKECINICMFVYLGRWSSLWMTFKHIHMAYFICRIFDEKLSPIVCITLFSEQSLNRVWKKNSAPWQIFLRDNSCFSDCERQAETMVEEKTVDLFQRNILYSKKTCKFKQRTLKKKKGEKVFCFYLFFCF